MCKRQLPGFDTPFSELQTLERGQYINLRNNDYVKALNDSEVLAKSIKLVEKFKDSNEAESKRKFASGVCDKCSPYYKMHSDGNIKPKVDYAAFVETTLHTDKNNTTQNESNTETDNFDFRLVNPWSAENLVSTCVWNDEGYRLFVNTLTIPEQMVLTPLLVYTSIFRLRSNNVPFSRYGQICYPLKKPIHASSLPWYQFDQLPFVVMTFQDKLGSTHETMVDMNKIRKAIEFMTRTKKCPVYGNERKYYRFADEIPFTNDNMAQLSQSLQDPSRPSHPKHLRTIDLGKIHDRVDKPMQIPEFKNWLTSGCQYGTAIWDGYKAKCINNGKEPSEGEFFLLNSRNTFIC